MRVFAEKHYVRAIDAYSRAVHHNPKSPILYSNRAFAHLRLENYGSAVADATQALKLDPKYIKVG